MGALTTRLPFGPRHIGLSDSTTIAILCALIELISESPQNAKLVKVFDHITADYYEIRVVPMLVMISCGLKLPMHLELISTFLNLTSTILT